MLPHVLFAIGILSLALPAEATITVDKNSNIIIEPLLGRNVSVRATALLVNGEDMISKLAQAQAQVNLLNLTLINLRAREAALNISISLLQSKIIMLNDTLQRFIAPVGWVYACIYISIFVWFCFFCCPRSTYL